MDVGHCASINAGNRHLSHGVTVVRVSQWLMVAACVLGQPVLAAEPVVRDSSPLALLQKMQKASRQLDYSGVFIYQQGPSMQSTRVVHVVDGTGERERLEMLDGIPREFIRHNDNVQCLIPDKKLIILEDSRSDRFPGLLVNEGKSIPDNYTIKIGKTPNRIAGRQCNMIELTPKDHQRFGYRFCADAKTSLLLKAQTLGAHGGVIDQISFTTLSVGEKVAPDQLVPSWNTQGWRSVQTPMQPVNLAKMGWRIPAPAGFVNITQVSRPMKAGKRVNQLVLSDGLAAISVFIEPFDHAHQQALPKGAVRKGALNIYGARIGDNWFTVVGEVPSGTLRDIAKHTEYVPAAHK